MTEVKPCVLVVEDEHVAREVLCDALEAEGCESVGVADGGAAQAVLEKGTRPCVILLDLMMPGMNGWAFRAWQQAQAELAAIPVVVLSAVRGLKGEAGRLGVAGYLEKPVKFPELLQAVEKHCGPCHQ